MSSGEGRNGRVTGSARRRPTSSDKWTHESHARFDEPRLPARESAVDLGAELISVRRGGATVKVSADELMMDRLVGRALQGNLTATLDLYARLDREEDAALGDRSVSLSPYMHRQLLQMFRDVIRKLNREAVDLLEAGLAEVRDGRLVVSRSARDKHHAACQVG